MQIADFCQKASTVLVIKQIAKLNTVSPQGTDCLTLHYVFSFPTPEISHPRYHGFIFGFAPTHPQSVSSVTLSGHGRGHQGIHHSA